MQIEGTSQGKFGGSLMHNHQPAIELISFSHKLNTPLDVSTQQPIAKTVHGAVRVVKKIDRTSVKFYAALTRNEVIKTALIFIVDTDRPNIGGNNFTISLGDSIISEINQIKSPILDASSSSSLNFVEYEEIALNYQNITWKFGDLSHSEALQKS